MSEKEERQPSMNQSEPILIKKQLREYVHKVSNASNILIIVALWCTKIMAEHIANRDQLLRITLREILTYAIFLISITISEDELVSKIEFFFNYIFVGFIWNTFFLQLAEGLYRMICTFSKIKWRDRLHVDPSGSKLKKSMWNLLLTKYELLVIFGL